MLHPALANILDHLDSFHYMVTDEQLFEWENTYRILCHKIINDDCAHQIVHTLSSSQSLENLAIVFHQAEKNDDLSYERKIVDAAWGENCTPQNIISVIKTLYNYGDGGDALDFLWLYLPFEKFREHLKYSPESFYLLFHEQSFKNNPNLLKSLIQFNFVSEDTLIDFLHTIITQNQNCSAVLNQVVKNFPHFFPRNTFDILCKTNTPEHFQHIITICQVEDQDISKVLTHILNRYPMDCTDIITSLLARNVWNEDNFSKFMTSVSTQNRTVYNAILEKFISNTEEKFHVLLKPYLIHSSIQLFDPLQNQLQKMMINECLVSDYTVQNMRKKM